MYEVNGCFRGNDRKKWKPHCTSRFSLDGKEIVLDTRMRGANNTRSGPDGFEKKMRTATEIFRRTRMQLLFQGQLLDGERWFSGRNLMSLPLHMK